jgi:thiamine-monophosphate kinase
MGEFDLLARLRERLPPPGGRVRLGIGDDAAVTVPGGATATSVDAFVDGVHFRRNRQSLEAVGRKGLSVALSDLAAMGASPGEAYVTLGVPPDLDEDGCLEVLAGVAAIAAATGTVLAGGDVTRSPVLALDFAVVGHAAAPEDLVTRGGATPGDRLVLTGELGGAAAGLLLLDRPELGRSLPDGVAGGLTRRLLDPAPRLAAGAALAAAGARAMIDLSDGLGADAGHVAAASGARLVVDLSSVPLAEGVAAVAAATGAGALELASGGGEDYELLAAVPPQRVGAAIEAVTAAGTALVEIGEVAAGEGVELRSPDGGLIEPRGFDQLR